MPYSEKQVVGKITRTSEAWEEHALDAKFVEMTLDQFNAKMKPSFWIAERRSPACHHVITEPRTRLDRDLGDAPLAHYEHDRLALA